MDGSFIDQLVQHTVIPRKIEGKLWLPQGWKRQATTIPQSLQVQSLTAIKDFVKANIDGLTLKDLAVLVTNPIDVSLLSKIQPTDEDDQRRRVFYLNAICRPGPTFGQWMEPEVFIIWLMSQFDEGGDKADVLELVSSLKAESVLQNEDDSYAQNVVAKSGIASVAAVKVQNPVSLQPYRTFPEVKQPVSDFVIRFRTRDNMRPSVALFESDGGHWEVEAVKEVGDWLRKEVPEVLVIA